MCAICLYLNVVSVLVIVLVCHTLLFSEAEESGPEDVAKDDEIFFGPVGHTEKCVAVAVNEVAQASDKQRPLSPLTATQMAEVCREAYTVAYRIEHVSGKKSSKSYAGTFRESCGNKPLASKSLEGLMSAETRLGPYVDKALLSDTVLDFTLDNTESRSESCGTSTSYCNSFDGIMSYLGSALPVIETKTEPSVDEALLNSTIQDLASENSESRRELCGALNTTFEGLSSVDSALPVIESADAEEKTEQSASEVLLNNTIRDLASDDTELRRESCGSAFDGLLSALGSALPVVEPGSLKQDERGVVNFSATGPATAPDKASAADATAKRRTAIPAPSGLRRASSAKTAAVRSGGIPVKVLTVRSDRLHV